MKGNKIMIKWKGKEYRNMFDMDFDVFQDWCDNSEEFAQLARKFAEQVKHDYETNPYFNAEECCVWSCPYNSGYDHDVQMGEITLCHKFKWEEENTCKDIEHYYY